MLTHLFLSQIVSYFLFLWDQESRFFRTVIQTQLGGFFPNVLYLRKSTPLFSSISQRSCRLICSFERSFFARISKYRPKLLQDLRDMLFPVPLYRSSFSKGPRQDVLCRVKKLCVRPRVKSLFRLPSEALPVKKGMKCKVIFVPWSVDCHTCKML